MLRVLSDRDFEEPASGIDQDTRFPGMNHLHEADLASVAPVGVRGMAKQHKPARPESTFAAFGVKGDPIEETSDLKTRELGHSPRFNGGQQPTLPTPPRATGAFCELVGFEMPVVVKLRVILDVDLVRNDRTEELRVVVDFDLRVGGVEHSLEDGISFDVNVVASYDV